MGSIARRSSGELDGDRDCAAAAIRAASSRRAPGFGAIYELARIIDTFRRELREDKLTFNVGLIGGGATAALDNDRIRIAATGKTNIIAATAIARGDLRAIDPGADRPAPRRRMQRDRRQAAARREGDHRRSTGRLSADGADRGQSRAARPAQRGQSPTSAWPTMGELDPVKRGAGDISFVAADVDGLAGLGPASRGDHAPGRSGRHRLDLRQAKRAAILMSRLAAGKP